MNFFTELIAILMAICTTFLGIMDKGPVETSPEAELVKETQLVLTDAMYAGQGITTDGKYYYTSGSLTALGIAGLAKWDMETMELVKTNDDAIPEYYKNLYGSDHIGGISYYNGKIYAAVENKAEDFPLVVTYDPKTLEQIDIYKIPNDNLPDGIPWCAVDGENGYLYCSPFKNVTEILVFDLDTMEYSHSIKLSQQITRIQGGEVYGGVLYLSYDVANNNTDKVLAVDVETGHVDTLFERKVPSKAGNEAEGLTVYLTDDGAFIHVLDYDKTVGVYLRSYKLVD